MEEKTLNLPDTLMSLHSIPLLAPSFAEVTVTTDTKFPKNNIFQPLEFEDEEPRFSNKMPFTFENLRPSEHTLLLQPEEVPIPQKSNEIELNERSTYLVRGIEQEYSNTEQEDQELEKFKKMGNNKIPSIFYENSNDYIPSEIKDNIRITSVAQYEHCTETDKIEVIIIENVKIPNFTARSIYKKIESFHNVEILSLNGTKISRVPDVTLPKLRIATFCDNRLDSSDNMINFAQHHPKLAILDFRRNKIAQNEKTRLELTATVVNLKYLNGRQITVKDRVNAMKHFSQKFKPKDIGINQFLFRVKHIPEIAALEHWEPNMILHLSLPNCGLTHLSLNQFTNLVTLNVSGNNIFKLDDSGIIYCQKLISLDISNNEICDFSVIPYIRSLLHVRLNGNQTKNYRNNLIQRCSKNPGSAAQPGLQSIDGVPVSLQEFLEAVNGQIKNSNQNNVSPPDFEPKWLGNLYKAFGNTTFETDPNILQKITNIHLINRGLYEIDVSKFDKLTHLILRGNSFRVINGIEKCINLNYLDASHNEVLDINSLIYKLKPLTKLQFLMVAIDCWNGGYDDVKNFDQLWLEKSHPMSIHSIVHRQKVVGLAVQHLPSLSSVDRSRITVPERINVLKRLHGDSPAIEEYRTKVALAQASKPAKWLDLHPEVIDIGKQYDPVDVIKLHRLAQCDLKNIPILTFERFVNLEELDLSRNSLKSLTVLRLENCKKLKMIDVSYNDINESPETVANLIDSIPELQMLSIRCNPIVNTQAKREKLISCINRLTNPHDTFRVLDCEILPQLIYQTHDWPASMKGDKLSRMLYSLALKVRIPVGTNTSQLTTLNLEGCKLTFVDISKFKSITKLNLSNNEITSHDDIIGLNEVSDLKILDLRNNKIDNLESFVFIITWCPQLMNIGVSGNPCAKKNYRNGILQHIPSIAKPTYPLISIDNEWIKPIEIQRALKENQIKELDKFCFELAVARNIDTKDILDLSNSMIQNKLELQKFPNIKLLSLKNNLIGLKTLAVSGIDKLSTLEFLDVSKNRLADEEGCTVAALLSLMPALRRLEIYGNPVCPKKDNWIKFLAKFPRIVEVSCPLQIINGHELTLDDRVSVINEISRNIETAEAYRCEFLLWQHSRTWQMSRALFLSRMDLMVITPLSMTMQLQILDLSHNNIRHLKNMGLEKLVHLTSLDIHDNNIETIEEIREALMDCPKLTQLFMVNSTINKKETDTPHNYVGFMCNMLRGLNEIDHYENPKPLKANQLNALKDIEQITGWNNPNHIYDIDLSNRNVSVRDFTTVLLACAALAPKMLSFKDNPCTQMEKYRFLVIYHVPDVQLIDGVQVTIDQRMNADKSVRTTGGSSVAENVVIEGALVVAEYIDKEERNQTIENVKLAATYAAKFGTMLMKWEIFITFQQILVLIIDFVDKIKWPEIFLDFSWLVFPFTIDLSFLSFLLDIRLPFWYQYASFFIYIFIPALLFCIYHVQPNRKRWSLALTKYIKRTMLLALFGLFMMVVCSIGLALLADLNYTIAKKSLTNNQKAWMVCLCCISLLIYIVVVVVCYVYYKNRENPVVWFKAMKLKKRSALFFVTVLYFPVCKAFVDTFTCTDGHLKAFAELECLTSIDNLRVVHIAAFCFGIFYAIYIPIFFVKLINKGVREIDLNYRIDIRLKQLKEDRKELKKRKKEGQKVDEELKLLKATEKDIKLSYSKAAIEYENAAAYLYNGYDRKDRYKKVISMIEKLLYLLCSSFIPQSWVQAGIATGTMFLMTLYQVVFNPFCAFSENVIEGLSKVFGFVTLCVGEALQFDIVTPNERNQAIIGWALIAFVILLLVVCFVLMIKYNCCCKSKTEEDSEEEEEDSQESHSNEDSESSFKGGDIVETLKTLKIGTDTLKIGRRIDTRPESVFAGMPPPTTQLLTEEANSESSESIEDVDTLIGHI